MPLLSTECRHWFYPHVSCHPQTLVSIRKALMRSSPPKTGATLTWWPWHTLESPFPLSLGLMNSNPSSFQRLPCSFTLRDTYRERFILCFYLHSVLWHLCVMWLLRQGHMEQCLGRVDEERERECGEKGGSRFLLSRWLPRGSHLSLINGYTGSQ